MRNFALFVVLLAGSLLLAAVLTYPAWLLVATVSAEPVHRVMNRLAMLIALVGLIVLTRRLGLSNRTALGYGLPRAEFLRQLGIGWAAGIGLMLPLVALLLALDVRQIKPGLDGDLLGLLVGGVLSGLVVAFIEETFFRGVLFTAVERTSGAGAAIARSERAVRRTPLPRRQAARAARTSVVGARIPGVEPTVRALRAAAGVRRFVPRAA